ncbi:NYN domain-containing protein [uncultured Ferrovibrio sp.]|uniref:NYN domain-containing protein n=1 Tax=uncultured Ferrovibrio sp. TaxID=1576913 RepID=UPI002638EBF1|nr:NYN domain-containing protein [uncultured Ferrovibrio sp.]
MDTIVYIDGFNLYYCCLRKSPYRWLNLSALARNLLPNNNIVQAKYFTANVTPRPGNPQQHTDQQAYLRALATLPDVEIIRGHFLSHPTRMPLTNPLPGGPRTVEVMKTEEKGSDVNLAAHMLIDGIKGRYKVAVVISNDSDLATPIRMVKDELGLKVGVMLPLLHNNKKRHPSRELTKRDTATFVKRISEQALKNSLFPPIVQNTIGPITKPTDW